MTLTEAARTTKSALIALLLTSVIVFFGWGGFSYWYNNIYLPGQPKEIIKPTADFGQIPPPVLPNTLVSSSNYTYVLETETGNLPTEFPEVMPVYFIPQTGATFLAPDKARDLAKRFGFDTDPEILSSSEYIYRNQNGEIKINLDTGNFTLNRPNLLNPESTGSAQISASRIIDDQGVLISNFKSYLQNKGLLNEDLRNGWSKADYNKSTQAESDLAYITLRPVDIKNGEKNYPIFTSKYPKGLINTIANKANDLEQKYFELEYIFWQPDLTKSGTYGIKNVDTAFKQLQNGEATVVVESNKAQVSISTVELGYYQTENYSPYLQPIYLFRGDDFAAFVTALKPEHLSTQSF